MNKWKCNCPTNPKRKEKLEKTKLEFVSVYCTPYSLSRYLLRRVNYQLLRPRIAGTKTHRHVFVLLDWREEKKSFSERLGGWFGACLTVVFILWRLIIFSLLSLSSGCITLYSRKEIYKVEETHTQMYTHTDARILPFQVSIASPPTHTQISTLCVILIRRHLRLFMHSQLSPLAVKIWNSNGTVNSFKWTNAHLF